MKPRGIYLEIFRISFHNLRLSQTQVVTILRKRAKQEEPYLEWMIEVLPPCLDPHLSKWGSLSRILRTAYIDL